MTDEPSFASLLAPLAPELFLAEHFERSAAVITRDTPGFYETVLTVQEVDRFLAGAEHRFPDVYLVNAADPTLKPSDYCHAEQRIDLRRLTERFAQGATIVLFGIETRFPAIKAICRAIEQRFSVACEANVYLTPAGAHGLKPHYDNHDVFVLQVAGSKAWTLFDSPLPLPLPGQGYATWQPEPGPVSQCFTLHAGDMLYCPRGLMHDAEAGHEVSLHITLGLKARSWMELMIEAVAEMGLNDVAFRHHLPIGFATGDWDRAAAKARFSDLIERLGRATVLDTLMERMADSFIASRPAPGEARLSQMLHAPAITQSSVVGAWPNLIFRLAAGEAEVRVIWQGPDLVLPAFTAEALRFALTTPRFTAADLPGEIDMAGRLVLLRRLLREGLIKQAVLF